jgi:hypothetical protein
MLSIFSALGLLDHKRKIILIFLQFNVKRVIIMRFPIWHVANEILLELFTISVFCVIYFYELLHI